MWAWQADVQVGLTIAPDQPYLDGSALYTATVTNNGPDQATGVTLTMVLPPGTTLVNQEPAGDYSESQHRILWTVGDLSVSQTETYTVELSLPLRDAASQIEIFTIGHDPSSVPAALFRALPDATTLELLQSFGDLTDPTGLIVNGLGEFLVLDQGDPVLANGETPVNDGRLLLLGESNTVVLSSGELLFNPRAAVVQPGRYLVVEPQGFAEGLPAPGSIIAVDPVSGAQSVFAEGSLISLPQDIINDDDGAVVVLDGSNTLFRVSSDGGNQTLLTSGDLLLAPSALARDSAGAFWVADQQSGIIKISGTNFTQEQIKPIDAGNTFEAPFDLLVSRGDRVFVNSFAANGSPQQNLLEINPLDGAVLSTWRYESNHRYRGMLAEYAVTNELSAVTTSVDPDGDNNMLALNNVLLPSPPVVTIQVSETITVADSDQTALAVQINEQETVTVADADTVAPATWIRVSESIQVTDDPQPMLAVQVMVQETIGVGDSDVTQLALQLAVQETVRVGESETVQSDSGGPGVTGTFLPGLRVISEHGELVLGETQMWLQFSELLQDPPGDGETADVTNPIHYQLVGAGVDGLFQTETCGDQPSGDDAFVGVARVVWLPKQQTAAVRFERETALGAGLYRMLICGDRGLVDLENIALDGDGDNKPGGDYRFDFRVLGDNLLRNPHFDQDLGGWIATQGDGAVSFSERDPSRSGTSGSARFPATETPLELSQCIIWPDQPFWQIGGLLQIGPDTAGEQLQIRVDWYGDGSCEGAILATQQRTVASNATESSWIPFLWQGAVPEGAVSAAVSFQWPNNAATDRYLDRLYFSADAEVRLIDNFDSGTLDLWRIPEAKR
nr:hypothetical protein [Acanthopleuribacter pedis]